jgi:AraC family transcriptional regulator
VPKPAFLCRAKWACSEWATTKSLGRGPAKEILRVRVEHAKTLLAETDETLKSVAADLGFRSLAHFAYVFRRETGITPAEYRGQNRLR